ncbi:hypothetical protein SDC9_73088 [bioreactor metagenome]|uniref:Uncharacterized protein n=1 Tax=bioreactor metagenome TaxID=1076179 RepID=A0A644YKD0_9ZZZZ
MDEFLTISGLAGMSDAELVGAIQRNPKAVKRAIVSAKKSTDAVSTAAATVTASRVELLARKDQLDPSIIKGLETKQYQLVDTYISVVKSISSVTSIEMLKDSDNKEVGVCMINGGKLEKDEPFMLTGLRLLYGVGGAATENVATISPINFGMISSIVAGGEFEFKANGKTLIPWCSLEIFKTHFVKDVVEAESPDYAYGYAFGTGRDFGMLRLENPKLIESQKAIEFNAKWGTAATASSFLKLILVGSRVYKH